MSNQFAAAAKKIEALQREALKASAAFRSYEVIQEKRAPNIIGKSEASRNAKAMGDFKGFFNVAEAAYQTEMFAALAKLYDESQDATSIPKLATYIEGNIKYLTTDDFKEYNAGRDDLPQRLKDYKPITLGDIRKVKAKLVELASPIAKLKNLRDKNLAHLEIKEVQKPKDFKESESKAGDLTYTEIDELINAAVEMLNYLGSKLNRHVSEFGPYIEAVTDDSERLIDIVRSIYDQIPSGDIQAIQ